MNHSRLLTVTVMLLLATPGCKESSTSPTQQATPTPPSASVTHEGKPTLIDLLSDEPVTDKVVLAFLQLTQQGDRNETLKVFDTPERAFSQRELPDATDRLERYIGISTKLRHLAGETISRGNSLRESGDAEAARRHYTAVLAAADANSWEGVVQIGKMTADSLRRAAEAELQKLPPN